MHLRHPVRSTATALLAVGFLLAPLAGCSDDEDSGAAQTGTPDSTTTVPESEPIETLRLVVTNDDGYSAEGIDALVEGLETLPDVEIEVVAPLEQRSGSGGTFKEGPLETEEVQTASGTDALAVDGYPADTLRVAIDELELDPHLVVSGINEGQNIAQLVDLSGTVGAARAGVARGIPSLAVSSGGPGHDYEAAVELVLDWIEERRDDLVAGDAPVEVASLNVPSCSTGEIRGVLEVPVAEEVPNPLDAQDCTSTLEDPPDDGTALLNGFATLTIVPDEPETPPTAGE